MCSQVCCLGAVGFTCWMIKAPISGYWAATANDRTDIRDPPCFTWIVARFTARGLSTAFLMGLFLKVDARSLPQKNPDVKKNHFLVPAMMLAILGAFLESLVDQYVGPLDSRLRFVTRSRNTTLFLCGFVLFVLLYFSSVRSFPPFLLYFFCCFIGGYISWLYFNPPDLKPSFFTVSPLCFRFNYEFRNFLGNSATSLHDTWHHAMVNRHMLCVTGCSCDTVLKMHRDK